MSPNTQVQTYSQVPLNFGGQDISSRLMNTNIVRIYPKTVKEFCKDPKHLFDINTIDRRDDFNKEKENELPLLHIEEVLDYCCGCCLISSSKNIFMIKNPNTGELFGECSKDKAGTRTDFCCDPNYTILPSINVHKNNNPVDIGTIERYDTRSVYRTYKHGVDRYKIGHPYVKVEESCSCCCCCQPKAPSVEPSGECCACCCCCCGEEVKVYDDHRQYIDIFDMADQKVGKFAKYHDVVESCCHSEEKFFYEIYFPKDADEMLRLALISQVIFFYMLGGFWNTLPGNREGVELFNK